MTNSLSEYLGKEKLKELFPSDIDNLIEYKEIFRFDISSVKNDGELLSVSLKFSDKSKIEFLISKKLAKTFGATLLNRTKEIEKEGE